MGEKSAKKSAAKCNKKFKKIPKKKTFVGGSPHNTENDNAKNGNKQFGFMDWIARIIGELLIWLRIMIIPDNNSEPPGNNNSEPPGNNNSEPPGNNNSEPPGNNNTSLHDTLSNIVNRLEALGYISS